MAKTAYFCRKCKSEVSYSEKMYGGGICPECGNEGAMAGVMDTIRRDYYEKKIPSGKWYIPDAKERIYYPVGFSPIGTEIV